jgi:hypothetical protein
VAYSSLLVRNFGSARRLAEFAVQGADTEMAKARSQRVDTERRRRLPISAIPVLAVAYLLWRRWNPTTAVLTASALSTVVFYNLLFFWEGEVYSLSTIGTWHAFVADSLVRMGTALIPAVCILVWLVWHQRRRSPIEVATLNHSYGLIVAFVVALPLAVAFTLNGVDVTWRLPDPLWAFLQISALVQLGAAALLTLPLPLVTIPLDRILRWARTRLTAKLT